MDLLVRSCSSYMVAYVYFILDNRSVKPYVVVGRHLARKIYLNRINTSTIVRNVWSDKKLVLWYLCPCASRTVCTGKDSQLIYNCRLCPHHCRLCPHNCQSWSHDWPVVLHNWPVVLHNWPVVNHNCWYKSCRFLHTTTTTTTSTKTTTTTTTTTYCTTST